ncbi:MAG: hypothetical protein ACRDNK_05715 [Solirubrobacteraceae bacterium]
MSFLWHSAQVVGSDPIEVAPRVWIGNRRRTRAWAAIAVAWSVSFACLPFISSALGGSTALGMTMGLAAFYFGTAAVGLVLAARVARAGIWIGADGIVVRGPFRTQSVALDNAARFVPGLQGRGGNGTPCPMLEREDQRAVGVWALGRRNIWFRYHRLCEEIQPLCDELNELVGTLRSGAPPSVP